MASGTASPGNLMKDGSLRSHLPLPEGFWLEDLGLGLKVYGLGIRVWGFGFHGSILRA